MAVIVQWLQEQVQHTPNITERIFGTVLILLAVLLLRSLLIPFARRTFKTGARFQWAKTVSTIVVLSAVLLILWLWIGDMDGMVTFLALFSAGIAIALRDPLVNLFGWAFIASRQPFEEGDRIALGDVAGDVIDLRLFEFSVLEIGNWIHADQSTGRIIHVPNSKVFTESVANYHSGFAYIWNEVEIFVTFESNWQKAKTLLQAIADDHQKEFCPDAEDQLRRASRRYLIMYRNLTPIVYTDVTERGIRLTIRHLTPPRRRRSSTTIVWEDVLNVFAQHDDIELAYQTYRVYHRPVEQTEMLPRFDTPPDVGLKQ